jgi:N-acetylmuramoyl-L-alanine amidase
MKRLVVLILFFGGVIPAAGADTAPISSGRVAGTLASNAPFDVGSLQGADRRPFPPAAIELAAAVLCGEARGEGRRGMQAVWEVVWTRAQRHGNAISNLVPVLTRPRHFSCLNGETPSSLIARMKEEAEWTDALAIASRPPATDLTAGADHFENVDRTPFWARGRKPVAVVGRHKFFRLNKPIRKP